MAETALKLEPVSDLADRFRRDGLVVIPGLFPERLRDEVLGEIVDVFALRARELGLRLPASPDHAAFSDLAAGLFGRDVPSYIAAAKLTQHLASVHRMGLCPELMAVVRELGLDLPAISTRPVIHYMADRLKIPGGYQKTPPHQDWRSVQGSLDGITIWTPLYDVGLNDYPLEVSLGSHLGGLMDATPDMPNYRVLPELYNEADFQPLEVKAGDAVIFSGFLLHRTGEAGGERVRISLSFRFNNVAETQFVRRNYPNPYIYRPDPAILTPDFPSAEALAEIFPEAGR
jgi:phytanoyl-CoA hydroxylase